MLLAHLKQAEWCTAYGWDINYPNLYDCAFIYTETDKIEGWLNKENLWDIIKSSDYKFRFQTEPKNQKHYTVYVVHCEDNAELPQQQTEYDIKLETDLLTVI